MAFNSFLNNSIKLLFVLLISIMLIIGTIFVLPPSFADDSSTFPSIPYLASADKESAYIYGENSAYVFRLALVGGATLPDDIFFYGVQYTNGYATIISNYPSSSFDSSIQAIRFSNNSKQAYNYNTKQNENYPDLYYFGVNGIVASDGWNFPMYDSIEAALEAVSAEIGGGSSSIVSYPNTVTVRPGYVAYILTQGGNATLTRTFTNLSKLSRPLFPDSLSTLTYSNDLPSSGTVFTSTLGGLIDWLIPASASKNLLGQTYIGGRPIDSCPDDGQYVVIYNPAYNADGSAASSISARFSNILAIAQFPLVTSFNNGEYTSSSEANYNDKYLAIAGVDFTTDSAITYGFYTTDAFGNVTSTSAISIPDNTSNIVVDTSGDNSIQGLVNKITDLLSAPVKHIQNLINAGSAFMSQFSQLYTWLPEPVLTVLVSALVLVIVIGVIKLLH